MKINLKLFFGLKSNKSKKITTNNEVIENDKNVDYYCKKYVVPYMKFPETKREVINNLKCDENLLEIISLLLTNRGWRERSFASTAVGVFQLDQFSDQIYQQALSFDENHASFGYAFALTSIESPITEKYLTELSKKDTTGWYDKAIQANYMAGLSIRTNLQLTEVNQIEAKKSLESYLNFWK